MENLVQTTYFAIYSKSCIFATFFGYRNSKRIKTNKL